MLDSAWAIAGPVDAVMKVSVSGLGRCEVDLQHLYLGHVAVEATLLGLVLGATLSVSLGLFTVALCHYLGVARLMLALSSTEPSCGPAIRGCIPRSPRLSTRVSLAACRKWLRANGGTAGTSGVGVRYSCRGLPWFS